MDLAQGWYQPDALRSPQWRHARLNGVSIVCPAVTNCQLTAGRGLRLHGPADRIQAATRMP